MTRLLDNSRVGGDGSLDESPARAMGALGATAAPRASASRSSASGDLVALYAARTTLRVAHLRGAINEHRGTSDAMAGSTIAGRASGRTALMGPVIPMGRGTPVHRETVHRLLRERTEAEASGSADFRGRIVERGARLGWTGLRRKLITASLALGLVLVGATTTLA